MKTPYKVLGVSEDAADDEIKKIYLHAVRNNPPDREPEKFQEIRQAWEKIATLKDRLRYELFDTSTPDSIDIAEVVFAQAKGRGITERNFRNILSKAVNRNVPKMEQEQVHSGE